MIACVCCIRRKICGHTNRSGLLSHHWGLTCTHTVPFSGCLLSSPPPPPFLSKQLSFPASLFPLSPSVFLCSEVGHSGSPVYSNAAASRERERERVRGHGEKHRRVEEKQAAYFNIRANPHRRSTTRTSAVPLVVPATVNICIYDSRSLMGHKSLIHSFYYLAVLFNY